MKPERVAPSFVTRLLNDYRFFRALSFFWMTLIFFLSSRSDVKASTLFWGQDKVGHAVVFGILGFLIIRSFRHKGNEIFSKAFVLTILLVAGYGLFDELHQWFVPGRQTSPWDFLADVVGGTLGAILFRKHRVQTFSLSR